MRRVWVGGLGALVVVLFAAGCGSGSSDVPTPTTGPAAPETTGSSAPAGTGRTYDAVGLDLCARTDLGPLADLSLTVERREPKQPRSAPGAACLFEMRTRSGHQASLLVEASTLGSADEAGRLYRATQDVSEMNPDGAVDGVGDEAEAFAQQSEPGFRYAEYMIHTRSGNLVLKVWLAVGGTAFTPKDVLAAKVETIVKATLSQVPES
ncbi:hypothetical protein ACI2K4_33370 [Micromonospora sp. NPDC050397]|uniref:hypothetical protein n=1 Tax=Micromonospora sp. NPDC050397 TaxID=3364279 RepID=UPI0038502EC7